MTKSNKTFEYEGVTYTLGDISAKERQDGKAIYRKTFFQSLEDGAFLQSQTTDKAIEWKVWSEEKSAEFEQMHVELDALIKKLEAGGYDFEEAVSDAKEANKLREKIMKTNLELASVLGHSAERYAEDAQADFILWAGLKKGKQKVYPTFAKFEEARDNNDPIIDMATSANYGDTLDYYKELPENKFLIEFGRMNEDLQYLDENGEPLVKEQPIEKVERKPFIGAPEVKSTEPKEPSQPKEEPKQAAIEPAMASKD